MDVKVLVIIDADAHAYVFSYDSPEERGNTLRAIMSANRAPQASILEVVQAAIDDDEETIEEVFERLGWPVFDRSGGGRMYVTDLIAGEFPSFMPSMD